MSSRADENEVLNLLQAKRSMESLLSDSSEDALEMAPVSTEDVRVNGGAVNGVGEETPPQSPRKWRERRISVRSTSTAVKMEVIKEGKMLQQSTFQRWVKKYLTITGGRLYIGKNKEDKLTEEIVLKDVTVAENSTKNINNSFTLLTPFQQVPLAAGSRKEMEEWISAFTLAASLSKHAAVPESLHHLEGHHSWFSCSHSRPTYCNVCREALHGVAWHGLSCEVCKFKSHRRCVFTAVKKPCKWTVRENIVNDGLNLEGDFSIPHQWLEGNLAAGSKCVVCEKACGSVRRLQDFRCLWCKATVHRECTEKVPSHCTLGEHSLSILPPSAIQRSSQVRDHMWGPHKVYYGSPVLALVNSKSGDNQGVKFLRRLKYWLNPAQVFDLAISEPDLGLQLFAGFEKFRVIVLGGDGSIGWVLSAMDKYNLHSKCIMSVVPLGTGNDLARVLGWGAECHDEEKLPSLLSEMEHSSFKLLDRWSLQYTSQQDVDISSLLRASSPKSERHSSVGQSLAPFPGPGSRSIAVPDGGRPGGALTPDSVFAHQDSGSDGDYKSANSRTPTPEGSSSPPELERATSDPQSVVQVEIDITDANGQQRPSDIPRGRKNNQTVDKVDNRDNQELNGVGEGTGLGCDLSKIEAFHDSLASHLSTILLSEDSSAVVASAQVLCQAVKGFLGSVVTDMTQQLGPAAVAAEDARNHPLVQRCVVLQQKLQGLLTDLGPQRGGVTSSTEGKGRGGGGGGRVFQESDALMARANSLKKALQGVIDITEKALDDTQSETRDELTSLPPPPPPTTSDEVAQQQRQRTSDSNSSRGSVTESAPPLSDMKEINVMNNYFGVGIGAKIVYDFSATREKNPGQYKSRAKNRLLYGLLAGREIFTNSQRYLERRVLLECDGRPIPLPPKLQGLVFLNIPSYMAGTNFWGTEREKDGFCAPSHDDKLMEVAGITGSTHLATTKVLGIQNQRLVQCRVAKLTFVGPEQTACQVDGEPWLQEPGTIVISHKNKARMLFKDKAFTQTLESWKARSVTTQSAPNIPHLSSSSSSSCLPSSSSPCLNSEGGHLMLPGTEAIGGRYRDIATSVVPLIECIELEAEGSGQVQQGLLPQVAAVNTALERTFQGDRLSQYAESYHLDSFMHEVKALVQESLWYLNMNKISDGREAQMRSCVQAVELATRQLLTAELSTASQAHHGFRRASDTLIMRPPQRLLAATSPGLRPHRERSNQIVPDATMEAATVARNIEKEVRMWTEEDVCEWLHGVGLADYDENIHQHSITGPALLDMRHTGVQNLGITKVGHLTRLRQALQALTSPDSPALSRSKQSRDSVK